MNLRDLRQKATANGLTGYSRMRRADLETALADVIVRRGDIEVRRLGRDFLRSQGVGEWEGKKRYGYRPLTWLVPRFLVEMTKDKATLDKWRAGREAQRRQQADEQRRQRAETNRSIDRRKSASMQMTTPDWRQDGF
jgi:hypothetical protein